MTKYSQKGEKMLSVYAHGAAAFLLALYENSF